uniref:NADH-ubiquinone oxidoreductase chain 3 n=1 Tax=Acanthormius sp. QL-2013 TaxID=1421592 RepID=A0A0A6ZLM9_9HYME|nr:NADH dehydrogenase subunit 3 [Acanthormius sp. QL-2013]
MLVLIFLIIIIISLFLMLLNLFLSKKEWLDRDKMSSFECGFISLSVSRLPFSIMFYLIGILFLLFDVEVVFLFPFISLMNLLNLFEWFYINLMILLILYIGLEFEKKEGSLKWMF